MRITLPSGVRADQDHLRTGASGSQAAARLDNQVLVNDSHVETAAPSYSHQSIR